MAEKTLNDLFLDTLKDIYFAEKQILKALPKDGAGCSVGRRQGRLPAARDETQGQIERWEQVFELLGRAARGKTCEAIQGIIAEGEEIMEEYKGSVALDAGLISSAQAVEHYEIARYGTLIEEDVIGFVSAMAFRPMEDGEMVMRLSEENGDILDLRTNPVCAGRFAIALLDLISQNGWFDVDLRVSDRGVGNRADQAHGQNRVQLRCRR
jgi:ferritin-like metal-binding protein YciE